MDNTVEAQVESLNEWRVRYEASAETEEEADPSAEPVVTAPSADVVLTDVAQPLTSMIRNESAVVVKVHDQQ
jgi:hypothetical protein